MATRRIGLLWHILNATLTGATTNKWLARSNKSRLSRLECTSQAAGRVVFLIGIGAVIRAVSAVRVTSPGPSGTRRVGARSIRLPQGNRTGERSASRARD